MPHHKEKKGQAIAIIPARYASTRFPGKPLALIQGKTLIQRTYENTLKSPIFSSVFVATDDDKIFKHVEGFGGRVLMTREDHPTGTDRLVEALDKIPSELQDIVVNVQGDEPTADPSIFTQIVELLLEDPTAVMSTAVTSLSPEDAARSSVVKCVVDQQSNAMYFSRACIPGTKAGQPHPKHPYLKHIGIYGFRLPFLRLYSQLAPTPLQQVEDLEQLKVLEWGYKIRVAFTHKTPIGVDLPEDIAKVENELKGIA